MLDEALRALSEPHRREILALVRHAERTSTEIAGHFNVTRPAISQHLGVLEDAGLVSVRREGTRRLYRARPLGLIEIREFIEAFWDAGVERLAEAAEAEQRRLDGDGTTGL